MLFECVYRRGWLAPLKITVEHHLDRNDVALLIFVAILVVLAIIIVDWRKGE